MIKQVQTPSLFNRILAQKPFFNVCMQASYQLYNSHPLLASFYTIDKTAAMSVTGHSALLCGSVKCKEELASFLNFCGVTRIKTDGYIPNGFAATGISLMLYSGGEPPSLNGGTLCEEPDLREVAKMLCNTGSEISEDNFYSDACMRRVRGMADVLAIKENGLLCSTAGVYAVSEQEAYIAAVMTKHECRGKGYASYLVAKLAQKYAEKRVILVCDADMCGFYEKLGFKEEKRLLSAKKIVL
ncbi:MAG: GNAT family N-acetyltransferase [Oscillospiraceae bacterium]